MDDYTRQARALFDRRFAEVDSEGIYISHQPIYGFREGHTEPFGVNKYVRSYQIMKSLARLRFSSLLDVGGAEGYKAGLAGKLFGVKCFNTDLSEVACKRAVRLFGIPSVSANIGSLPFGDEDFDVVLCSETLEHVADPERAVDELLRIAKYSLVVTVPHDPESVVETCIERQDPRGHIHRYDERSFDGLKKRGYMVRHRRMLTWATMMLGVIVEAMPIERAYIGDLPYSRVLRAIAAGLVSVYNRMIPLPRLVFGRTIAALIIELDDWLCRVFPTYGALIFVILKDPSRWAKNPRSEIRALDVLGFSVPYNKEDRDDEY